MSKSVNLNSTVSSSQGLSSSLEYLISSIQNQPQMTPEKARQYLVKARVNPEELSPWANFDHSPADSYGRQMVYDGGYFEVMVMSWVPGDHSAIHDHGSAQWGAVQFFGEAKHFVYTLENGVLTTSAEMNFKAGSVWSVDHDLIHQMGNASQSPFLSLHIYGGDKLTGSVTSDTRLFDLFEGSIQYTDGGVFFGLPEAQISQRSYGLRGDCATTLRHNQQMRERICRMLAANNYSDTDLISKLEILEQTISLLKQETSL